jgi:hypothetical protein
MVSVVVARLDCRLEFAFLAPCDETSVPSRFLFTVDAAEETHIAVQPQAAELLPHPTRRLGVPPGHTEAFDEADSLYVHHAVGAARQRFYDVLPAKIGRGTGETK